MMYTMPKNLLSICVNFALATQLLYNIRQDFVVSLQGGAPPCMITYRMDNIFAA